MSTPLASFPAKLGSSVVSSDIFFISDSTSANNNKITTEELSKAFTGLYAQTAQGFTIFENTENYGLSISGAYGFVGINDRTPFVSLDVVDNLTATNGSGQIRLSTLDSGRKIAFSLSDPNVYYQFSKKPNDTKLYLESSINSGSTFTNLFVVDQSGNFGITNSTDALSNKFLVSGSSVRFQNSGNAILFDPYNTEIKTSATDETLLLNYNNLGDINIGYNSIFVDNSVSAPKIGIGHNTPAYLLHLSGIGQLARFQSSNAQSYASYKNSTATSYYGMQTNKIYFGSESVLSEKNLVYSIANSGSLGLGTTGPNYKLDVRATDPTDNTPASFQNTDTQGYCQIFVACNKAFGGGDTGPRNSLVTFSRYDATPDTQKWSIGNLYNDTTFVGLNDFFVFVKNGYGGVSPDVVAKLSPAGSLDIDGSYTSSDSYCKGKFIQTYQTRVTGFDVYFSAINPNSDIIPSGNNSLHAPFTITPYAGSIEKISIFTSDTDALSSAYRFEISAITPAYNPAVPSEFVTGFSLSPPSDPVSYPTSGIIGASYFNTINSNVIYSKTKANISGSTSFNAGQLLQFRLCEPTGGKSVAVDFTVVSTIAYTIT
jgi:hypothetical protein